MKKSLATWIAAALACASAGISAAEPATLIRPSELKEQPASDAPTLATLAEKDTVEVLERRGGWTQVKSAAGATGWVKMLALRYAGSGGAKPADSGIPQLFNVARSGTSGTQVTTGVRGLSAEQLAGARPNPAELQKLDGYVATPEAASGFAERGPLKPQAIEYPKLEGG